MATADPSAHFDANVDRSRAAIDGDLERYLRVGRVVRPHRVTDRLRERQADDRCRDGATVVPGAAVGAVTVAAAATTRRATTGKHQREQ